MKYSVKKIRVYPKEPVEWEWGVYLGMSMNNQMFQSEQSIIEMHELITKNINHYSILVGDYLHRFNEQIFYGCDEEEAIKKSLMAGNNLTNLFNEVVNTSKTKGAFQFFYSKDFLKRTDFSVRLKRFEGLYNSHERFHELVNHTIDIFLRRQENIKIPLIEANKLCKCYLLEEIVIFEILAEEGLRVNIYPGNQLPIIKEIIAGRLKGVSEALENIQAIEIKFRPS